MELGVGALEWRLFTIGILRVFPKIKQKRLNNFVLGQLTVTRNCDNGDLACVSGGE